MSVATINPRALVRRLFPTARRLLVERDLKLLECKKDGKVLVVGAGYDPYKHLFADAELYTALDVTPIHSRIDVVGDATRLPFREGSYDLVVAVEVLEHVPDAAALISEAHKVLRDKGKMILTVPFMFHMHADPNDYMRPTPALLELFMRRFSNTSISPQGNRLHCISDLLTTAFYPFSFLFPLRLLNYGLVSLYRPAGKRGTTAPSGFFVVAQK